MKSTHIVVLNTGILYVRMAITVFLSLYTTRLVLEALGVENFGIYNLVGGIVVMLSFLNSSMASATQRFMSNSHGLGDKNRQIKIFNISFIIHIFIALILFLVFEIVATFLFNGLLSIPEDKIFSAKCIFQFSILSAAASIVSVPYDAVINAREKMFLFSIISIAESILKLIIALIISFLEADNLIIYGLLMAALSFIVFISRALYCHLKYYECTIRIKKYFDFKIFREMSSFATWSLLGSTTSMLSNYGQGIVLNIFFGPVLNAAQGIVGQLSGQLSAFSTTMQRALNPFIVKSEGGGDLKLMRVATLMGSKMNCFLSMIIYIPFFIDMPYIMSIWLKEVPNYVVGFTYLLLLRNLIEQIFLPVVMAISATGNIKEYQIITSILNIFPLPITYFLFKIGLGPMALYWVFLVITVLISSTISFYAKVQCKIPIKNFLTDVVFRCFIVLLFSSMPGIIIKEVVNQGLMRLIIISIASFVTTIISIWIIGLNKIEKQFITSNLLIFSNSINKSFYRSKN